MQERGLSRRRVWGLVAVATLVVFGVWVCVFILVLALTFAPDAHIRFSTFDQLLQFGAPTLTALIALAITTKLLDRWTFGPIEDRRGTTAQRWTVRLFPVFLLILIAAMIMSYRDFSIGFGVEREIPSESTIPAGITGAIHQIRTGDARARIQAAEDLGKIGPLAHPALDDLVRLLDQDDDVCVAGVRAIFAIGPSAASAVPAIVRMARRNVGPINVSKCWAEAYGCKPLGAAAIPYLIDGLGADPDTDEVPKNMLGMLGAENALTAVTKVLNDGGVRAIEAADIIAGFEASGRPAAPALLSALKAGKIDDKQFLYVIERIGADDPASLQQLEISRARAKP